MQRKLIRGVQGNVRINEQHWIAGGTLFRTDRPHGGRKIAGERIEHIRLAYLVQRFAADAGHMEQAITDQGVPRLEMCDELRRNLGMIQ